MKGLFDLLDLLDVLSAVVEAVRHPREALRAIGHGLLALPLMIGGIAIVLFAALATMVVSASLSFLVGGVLTVALEMAGLPGVASASFGLIVVLGTLIPTFVITLKVYRRLPRRLRAGQEAEVSGSPVAAPPVGRPEPKLDIAELDARLALDSASVAAQTPARTSSRNASVRGERSSV
jgi:hypothetical protein